MRVLVVGAKGFVGAELTRSLLEHGHSVVALEPRNSPGRLADVADDIEWCIGDAADSEAVLTAIGRRGVDVIYYGPFYRHPPGTNNVTRELEVMAVGAWNVFGLARVLELKRVIFPSSTAVHGYQRDDVPVDEDSPVLPNSLYGAAKLLCERVGTEVNRAIGKNVITSIRIPSVYGPGADVGSRGVNVPAVQSARGWPCRVDYRADARLCIAHVQDTAAALTTLAEGETAAHHLYELGGIDVSFGEIVDAVKASLPSADISFGKEERVIFPHAVDASRGSREFGFAHRDLQQGTDSIIAHVQATARARRFF
jgi:nucleoside-diphosphate-sugar epimerase